MVGAVESVVTPCRADRLHAAGPGPAVAIGANDAPKRIGNRTSTPSPNVNASGGVPVKTSSGEGSRIVAGERVADREHVAVEVHAALRLAGRARGERDQGDVVARGRHRLEAAGAAARGQLVEGQHARSTGSRDARLAHLAGQPRVHERVRDLRLARSPSTSSPARSIGIVATTTPPASRIAEPARDQLRVVVAVQQHAVAGHEPHVLDEHAGDPLGARRAARRRSTSPRRRARRAGRPAARTAAPRRRSAPADSRAPA